MPNEPKRKYENRITCCASSGPRGLELYARHLFGQADNTLVINSYIPASMTLSKLPGKQTQLVIAGEYPFQKQATLTIKSNQPIELTLDLRTPVGADSMEATLDGQKLQLRKTPLGYQRLQRTWKPGETITLDFDMSVKAHFHNGRDGTRWVLFTYGPLVLAQDILTQKNQSQVVLAVESESDDASYWVEPIAERIPNQPPAWRLKMNRDILLVPYYFAGSTGGEIRTMFPTQPRT